MTDQIPSTRTTRTRSLRRALTAGVASLAVVAVIAAEAVIGSPSAVNAQTAPLAPQLIAATPANPIVQTFSFADIVERVRPAVVSIRVKSEVEPHRGFEGMPEGPDGNPMERFFREFRRGQRGMEPRDGDQNVQLSQGSGFLISADGKVVTNFHVVKGAKEVTVVTDDGTEYKAKVLGSDEKTDVALVKIDAKDKSFPTVAFAQSSVRVGDWVLAVGNPFGLGGTVTAGIVSARGREIGAGPYDDFLQIDAPINHGNSGGPTFNLAGEGSGAAGGLATGSGRGSGARLAGCADPAREPRYRRQSRHEGSPGRAGDGSAVDGSGLQGGGQVRRCNPGGGRPSGARSA